MKVEVEREVLDVLIEKYNGFVNCDDCNFFGKECPGFQHLPQIISCSDMLEVILKKGT